MRYCFTSSLSSDLSSQFFMPEFQGKAVATKGVKTQHVELQAISTLVPMTSPQWETKPCKHQCPEVCMKLSVYSWVPPATAKPLMGITPTIYSDEVPTILHFFSLLLLFPSKNDGQITCDNICFTYVTMLAATIKKLRGHRFCYHLSLCFLEA